jgi:hypothetical protein
MIEILRLPDDSNAASRRGRAPVDWRLAAPLRADIERQAGMVSRQQLVCSGASNDVARSQVRAGRWQRIHPRVYATFTGQLSREAHQWAALLYAGAGATLSHETAAEVWGLTDEPNRVVHVTIPVNRRVTSLATVRIHYANRLALSRHPTRRPPVISVEETVLDLVDRALTLQEVVSLVTRACQRRRTTLDRLSHALDGRKKVRWRKAMEGLLSEVAEGAHSPLELAYVQRVERPHGLPAGHRQHRRHVGGRAQWLDVWYEEYDLVVELDGRIGHTEDGRFRDHRRDNITTVRGCAILRYGWTDTVARSCQVAAEVAYVLRANGWDGHPRPCGGGGMARQPAA